MVMPSTTPQSTAVKRAKAASAAELTMSIGAPGLSAWGGIINEEYLTELKPWSKYAKKILEMQDDPIVGTLLESIKIPLLAAEFSVNPGGDSDVDKKAADFLWDVMNSMETTWRSFVRDQLEYLDFGFAVAEMV